MVKETPCHPLRILNADSIIVCNVLADIDSMPECKANARLIAAAPEMLEALKGVSIMLNAHSSLSQFDGEPWVKRVRAAIAKATGE